MLELIKNILCPQGWEDMDLLIESLESEDYEEGLEILKLLDKNWPKFFD